MPDTPHVAPGAPASPPVTSGESVQAIKRRAAAAACDHHDGQFPDGFRLYFRRYGSHGGRWRGVGPTGWVEVGGPNAEESASDELWWMVAAAENDEHHQQRRNGLDNCTGRGCAVCAFLSTTSGGLESEAGHG